MPKPTDPALAVAEEAATLTLPSGKVAAVRRGLGRDLRAAARVCSPAADPTGYSFALLAQLVTIDGRPIVAEDVDELDMEDVNLLLAALGKSQAPTTPSP